MTTITCRLVIAAGALLIEHQVKVHEKFNSAQTKMAHPSLQLAAALNLETELGCGVNDDLPTMSSL